MKKTDERLKNYLNQIVEKMTFGEARKGAQKEILGHLEEHIETARSYGLSDDASIAEAIKRMGNPSEIGLVLNRIHQPHFDYLLLILVLAISGFGLYAIGPSLWFTLQVVWMSVGLAAIAFLYFLPVRFLILITAGMYPLAIIGLIAAHFSGVVYDGQPFIDIGVVKIKMVDLSGILFSISLPAVSAILKKKWKSDLLAAVLFLAPLVYLSASGFTWPALVFLVAGLSYFGMQRISTGYYTAIGLIGATIASISFKSAFIPAENLKQTIEQEKHTDFILNSLSHTSPWAAAICVGLLVMLVAYGARLATSIKDSNLKTISISGISILGLHILVGILANFGFIPMIQSGVSLPFMSYGGSAIVANFFTVGILLACCKRRLTDFADV